jgi:hypothetical protein
MQADEQRPLVLIPLTTNGYTMLNFSTLSRAVNQVLLGCLICFVAIGCGPSFGSVSGTVTYNGKPLKGGYVTFVSTSGRESASATIQEDGTYKIPKIATGDYKVCVDTDSLKPTQGPPTTAMYGKAAAKTASKAPPASKPPEGAAIPDGYTPSNPADMAAQKNAKIYTPIPGKYGKADTTDLSFSVTGPNMTYEIVVK